MRSLLVASAVLLGASACSVAPPRRPVAAPPLPQPGVATLRQVVEMRREAVLSLRAEAHMSFAGPRGSGSAREAILVQRPDRLRVEVLTMFGTPFVLATANGHLAAYVRSENRIYRGAATAANLAPYFRFNLSVPDTVEILLGNPPRRLVGHGSVFPERASGKVRLRQLTAAGTQVVTFAGKPLVPVAAEEFGPGDALLWRARFRRHIPVQGVLVPLYISLEVPDRGERVHIEFEAPELNRRLGDELFALRTPPGAVEVRLD